MLRYSLILLLVNIYGRSLGGPVPEQNSNGKTSIANLLSDLTKQCKNKFVLGQIESKSSSCDLELNLRVPNLQCLLFYDANCLLCNSSANLETEFINKISEKQNFSAFCKEVSHLSVPSIPYQRMINTVFQNEDTCKKVCADDDISTGDTNFFCKYYMWTLLKLSQNSQQHAITSTAISSGLSNVQTVHSTDGQDKITSDTAPSSKSQTGKTEETNQHTLEVVKNETETYSTGQLADAHNPQSDVPSSIDRTIKKSTQLPVLKPDKDTLDTAKTAEDKREQLNQDPNDIGNVAGLENNGGNKDPDVSIQQIETPGQKVGLENVNGDGDDTGNENDDMDEDGKDLADDEDLNSSDVQGKFDQEVRNPDTKLQNQGSQNAEASQREFFQTTDGFTEDDDHFFPFFLTAVIVVVVLYVLYHNKNKVGKMFFGLIVEGRQAGRRRTSRGHAYRRLDTLEQAMSTNATAPPKSCDRVVSRSTVHGPLSHSVHSKLTKRKNTFFA